MRVAATGCCAVKELIDISTIDTPANVLKIALESGLLNDRGSHRPPFVNFTGVVERHTHDHASGRSDNYGQALVDFITTNGLGEVITNIPPMKNTYNMVKVWVWMPDYPALWAWYDREYPAKAVQIDQIDSLTAREDAAIMEAEYARMMARQRARLAVPMSAEQRADHMRRADSRRLADYLTSEGR